MKFLSSRKKTKHFVFRTLQKTPNSFRDGQRTEQAQHALKVAELKLYKSEVKALFIHGLLQNLCLKD